uniref:Uncharacterized protein n=1 Tax=viral metagenome TaxID=1070528 RepID=A0A6M3KTS4_9ZZZZ
MLSWCDRCKKYTESNLDTRKSKLAISTHYYCVGCKCFKESTLEFIIPHSQNRSDKPIQ